MRRWQDLVPRGPDAAGLPEYRDTWLLATSWPPWFTVHIWGWLRTLRWPAVAPDASTCLGASHLELLVNFVQVTGVCPPTKLVHTKGWTEFLDPRVSPTADMAPEGLRHWTHTLLDAVRQLQRLSHLPLLPPRRWKTYSLRFLGKAAPTRGIQRRPRWQDVEGTGALLQSVLREGTTVPLLNAASEHVGMVFHAPCALTLAHGATAPIERKKLAKACQAGR